MIWTVISTLLGIGGDALKNYQEQKRLEAEMEAKVRVAEAEAKIRYLNAAQTAEIEWDKSAVDQMEKSWKDEWFVILLSIPLILGFLPFEWAQNALARGFNALEAMPDWYVVALGLAISASFGYRKLVDLVSRWRGNK
jgi:hypothetical protein